MAVDLFRTPTFEQVHRAGLSAAQRTRLHQYAQIHLTDGLTAADLAAHIGLERDYFGRLFRRSFGCSPRAWLSRERIRAAARLLVQSDLPVRAVADAAGYADVAQFSRQFTRITGRSPRVFRRTEPLGASSDHTAPKSAPSR